MKVAKIPLVCLKEGVSYEGIFEHKDIFLLLGEIKQNPGHGIFLRVKDNKLFVGYHMDSFRLATHEDDI
jgi:hypothetical protein